MPIYKREQTDKERARSKKAKAARRKGKAYEKELCLFFDCELQDFAVSQGNQHGKGGKGNPDLLLQGSIRTIHVEAKKGKRVNIKAAYEQARTDARGTDIAVVCSHDDYGPELVTMSLMDFADLLNLTAEQQKTGHVSMKLSKGITYSVESEGE